MNEVPESFARVLRDWHPEPEQVVGHLGEWPAQALETLLAGHQDPGMSAGDPLPPLWHEVYLRTPRAIIELAADGHPRSDALMPPLADRRRMFGGGRITTTGPLRIGERARRTSTIEDARVRRGRSGWLLLLTEVHTIDVAGEPRVRDERDIVYRLAADVSRAVGAPETGAAAGPVPSLRLDTDERMLFLFSALTYNAHRIHYDRAYVTEVEGHRDLLVHGPLLALGCIEVARRHADRQAMDQVSYRIVAPAYVGAPVDFAVTSTTEGGVEVTGWQHGRPCVHASAGPL